MIKSIDVFENMFDFKKSIKKLADIDDEIEMVVESYKPKTKIDYDNKKDLIVF